MVKNQNGGLILAIYSNFSFKNNDNDNGLTNVTKLRICPSLFEFYFSFLFFFSDTIRKFLVSFPSSFLGQPQLLWPDESLYSICVAECDWELENKTKERE